MVDKAIDVATQESAILCGTNRPYREGESLHGRAMYPYAHDPDGVAFRWKLSSRHPCDDICDLYARADLWGMDEGSFQNDCWHHAGKAPMALKRRGAVIFLVFQSIWGSDEAGNHDPLAGSDSVKSHSDCKSN